MIAINRLLLPLLVILAIKTEVQSQSLNNTPSLGIASRILTSNYLIGQGNNAPIFNGRVYLPYVRLTDNGHTFFSNSQYVKGSITYDSYTYENVDIGYDIVRDQLILVHFDRIANIIVIPESVNSFFIHNHTFINLKPEVIRNDEISPGYYDLLHDGNVKLIAKRRKNVIETVTQIDIKRTISQDDRFYLLIDSVYRPIKSKRDLSRLLKSTNSQNQQYIRTNKLNFRRDREKFILSLVKYHDSLREQL